MTAYTRLPNCVDYHGHKFWYCNGHIICQRCGVETGAATTPTEWVKS